MFCIDDDVMCVWERREELELRESVYGVANRGRFYEYTHFIKSVLTDTGCTSLAHHYHLSLSLTPHIIITHQNAHVDTIADVILLCTYTIRIYIYGGGMMQYTVYIYIYYHSLLR